MTAARAIQWLLFVFGTAGALITAWQTLSLAGALLSVPQSGGWATAVTAGIFCGALGLAALGGIVFAYHLLRKGRWLTMALVLVLAALTVPTAATIAGKIIGPLPYDDQGRLLPPTKTAP